ncbi:MAG: hypothetical protein Q8874_01180 [Sweet potato little leaf phytoplasma]|nr:hypothetical protein [Sweet potato little leaf phytoplasma]
MAKKIIKIKKQQITKNKSNQIIIPRKSKIPKIIIENQKPQTNWLLKITKTLGNILLWSLPLLLIGGGLYWTLFKFFPDIFHQINAFTSNVALKTKTLYDKATQPILNIIKYIYPKITGNPLSPKAKLVSYLATTLSVIGICLGIGKIGNWLKKGKKITLKKGTKTMIKKTKKGTKAIVQKQATSRIANVGGKILKISSKVLGLISLAATAYELYQFYQTDVKSPNPPQQLTNKMENPSIPNLTQYQESTVTNNNEDKEEITLPAKASNEGISDNTP